MQIFLQLADIGPAQLFARLVAFLRQFVNSCPQIFGLTVVFGACFLVLNHLVLSLFSFLDVLRRRAPRRLGLIQLLDHRLHIRKQLCPRLHALHHGCFRIKFSDDFGQCVLCRLCRFFRLVSLVSLRFVLVGALPGQQRLGLDAGVQGARLFELPGHRRRLLDARLHLFAGRRPFGFGFLGGRFIGGDVFLVGNQRIVVLRDVLAGIVDVRHNLARVLRRLNVGQAFPAFGGLQGFGLASLHFGPGLFA